MSVQKNEQVNEKALIGEFLIRCYKDPELKKRFIDNPKQVLEEEFQVRLPDDFSLYVHEDSPKAKHIVFRYIAEDLTDEEMARIVGGWDQEAWDTFMVIFKSIFEPHFHTTTRIS